MADVLAGGAGTDSLTIYNSKGVAPQMSAIESLTLNTIADGVNYNASTATGLTSLSVTAAGGTNTFTVGSGVSVSIANTTTDNGADDGAGDVVVAYDAAATSASLTLNKLASGGANSEFQITGAALTTLNIATTGAASTIEEIVLPAKVDSLVITGDQKLTVTDAFGLATNATTKANAITSTGLTGDLSYSLTALGANQNLTIAAGNGVNTVTIADVNVDGSVTATFGSGKDVITLTDATGSVSINTGDGADKVTVSELDGKYNSTDKETASITLGAGDDTLTIANGLTEANLASGVTLAGGDGTDTLNIDNDEYLKLFDNATADVSISGFENLALQNGDSGTFDLSKVSGINKVVAAAGVNTGGALVLSNAAANSTLDWSVTDATTSAGAPSAITVGLKDSSGTADAFNINVTLKDTNDALDSLTFSSFVTAKDSNSKALETLNITANSTLTATTAATVKTAASEVFKITSLDLTGGVTTVNIAGTASTQIAAYATATTLVTVDASSSSGNNVLNIDSGSVFKGGSGNDTFSGTQANLAALSSITGNAGTDTIQVTDTAASTATLTIDDKAFKAASASDVENVDFSGVVLGNLSWTLGGYANAIATANKGVITATMTALTGGTAAADGRTIDASGLSGTNAINLTLTDTAVDATKAAAITITGSAGADTFKITESTANSVATISVTAGDGADTVTTSAQKGATTISAGNGDDTVTATSIGTAAGDVTITGGAGADTIKVTATGAAAADYLVAITGGTGADTITVSGVSDASAANSYTKIVVAAGDSTTASYDSITGFYVAGATRKVDTLDLPTNTVAGNATTNGSDFGVFKGHNIASGIIKLDDTDAYAAAVTITSSNLSDALGYLGTNIADGDTVAFTYDAAGDGTVDGTFVFQGNATADVLVYLVGVTGTAVGAAAATANLIGIV